VAEALTTTAMLKSSGVAGTHKQGSSSSSRHLQQQQRQQKQQRSMLPELAAAAAQQDLLLEPQLLLVFGPVLTLAGYPPFHTRVAEIQHMGPLASVRRSHIEAAVASYCQVLQRHGA